MVLEKNTHGRAFLNQRGYFYNLEGLKVVKEASSQRMTQILWFSRWKDKTHLSWESKLLWWWMEKSMCLQRQSTSPETRLFLDPLLFIKFISLSVDSEREPEHCLVWEHSFHMAKDKIKYVISSVENLYPNYKPELLKYNFPSAIFSAEASCKLHSLKSLTASLPF